MICHGKKSIISEILKKTVVVGDNPAKATLATGITLKINNDKLYASLVTLYINDNIKFLKHLNQGLRRKTSWNKYSSEIITKT